MVDGRVWRGVTIVKSGWSEFHCGIASRTHGLSHEGSGEHTRWRRCLTSSTHFVSPIGNGAEPQPRRAVCGGSTSIPSACGVVPTSRASCRSSDSSCSALKVRRGGGVDWPPGGAKPWGRSSASLARQEGSAALVPVAARLLVAAPRGLASVES